MAMINSIPASRHSKIESAANGGGTNTHACIGSFLFDGVRNCVEHGNLVFEFQSPFARSHSRDNIRSVFHALLGMESSRLTSYPRENDPSIFY